MVKSPDVVEIDAKTAAAIVRSDVVPTILRGTGGNSNGQEAVAEIGKSDVVKMVREGTLPVGAKIVGGA